MYSGRLKAQIIVLNYNGLEILPLCLPSLVKAAKEAHYPTSVTVLDNGSTDGSVEWVKKQFPEVRRVQASQNRFLVSFNEYVRQIDDDVVILMNNDVRVEADFADPLVRVFEEHPDAFLASSQTFSFDGSRYEGGRTRAEIRWGLLWSSATFSGHESLRNQAGFTFAAGYGAFHRKRFLALEGYDDLYLPGIIEDADLGFRAWREGYRSFYVPQSRVYHMGQASFQKTFGKKGILTLAHRNTFLFIWKNISDPLFLAEHFLFLVPRLVHAFITGRTELIRGFFQALGRWPDAWKKRKFPLRKARRDREIFLLANESPIRRRYLFKKQWKRIVIGILDGVGSVFSPPFFYRRRSLVSARKILVVRVDSLGDAVLTLPALEALKTRFPGAQIDFLTSATVRELYACFFPSATFHLFENDWLAMVKKLRLLHYDLGIDFRGDLRTLVLLALARIPHRWGRDGTGGRFLLTHRLKDPYRQHEMFENLELVKENEKVSQVEFPSLNFLPLRVKNGAGRKIVIHVGAGYPSKRWAISNFIEIAKRIHKKQLGTPVFIGQSEERKLLDPYRNQWGNDFLDLTEKTSLSELLTLLNEADLYIGNDSGPAHLAALLHRKIVLIFSGTNDFKRWAPWSSQIRLIHHPVPCSPCEERICPLNRQICLEDISIEEVFGAVQEALSD